MRMELNSSLPMYATAYKFIALLLAFLAIMSFSASEMWDQYGSILLHGTL